MTTAATIVRGALETIGVVGEGQTMTAEKAADGLRRLNLLVGSWAIQPGTIPVTAREVFALVAGQTSYTIGPGGNFNTARPAPADLLGAGMLLTTSTPPVEMARTVYTEAAYASQAVKGLSNGLLSGIYYQPTSPLGTIRPWPVPDTAQHTLVLYLRKALTAFADLTTSYSLPPGVAEALEYGLAWRLCGPYSVPVDPDLKDLARSSLALVKRANARLVDLPSGWPSGGGYDITTGA